MTEQTTNQILTPGSQNALSPRKRRASIKAIMKDSHLSSLEKRKSMQSLMDGRRRSSVSIGMKGLSIDANEDENASHEPSAMERDAALVASQILCEDDFSSSEEECGGMGRNSRKRRTSYNARLTHETSDLHFPTCIVIKDEKKEKMMINYEMVAYNHQGDPKGDTIQMELHRPHCNHYERKCSIISPCCGMLFGCRICHDECDALLPPFLSTLNTDSSMVKDEGPCNTRPVKRRVSAPSSTEEETQHKINRCDIKEVICRNCHQRQSSKR